MELLVLDEVPDGVVAMVEETGQACLLTIFSLSICLRSSLALKLAGGSRREGFL
jgi:hypothetical protein